MESPCAGIPPHLLAATMAAGWVQKEVTSHQAWFISKMCVCIFLRSKNTLNLGLFWSKTRVKTKKIDKKMHFSSFLTNFSFAEAYFLHEK
jgi:hypothetical protein